MTEVGSEVSKDKIRSSSRRGFVKTAIIGAVTAPIVANEIRKGIKGEIVTSVGTFYPIYESHSRGIEPHQIPSNLDAFFREYSYVGGNFAASPREILQGIYNKDGQKAFKKFFRDEILGTFAERNIPLVIGDVDIPYELQEEILLIVKWGTGLFGVSQAIINLRKEKRRGSEISSRRKFITRAIGAGSAWSLAELASGVAAVGVFSGTDNPAVKRITARINGLVSHTHPENSIVFFRNAVMAHKLLAYATHMKDNFGRYPHIAFNTGGGHQAIEDFLQAGSDVTRAIIMAYPDFYLREAVKANGGVDDFSSLRELVLPRDFRSRIDQSKYELESDNRIVDRQLKASLETKLA